LGEIALFSLLSAVYPTLLAATTVMLLLPKPERLMMGFWLGSMTTSVASGLVIVFALQSPTAVKTSKHLSPAVALTFAVLLVLAAVALAKGEDRRARLRYATRRGKKRKRPSRWKEKLRDGNPWHTFLVGILLSFPGIYYLAALDRLSKLGYSKLFDILVVILFCLVQLILIEVPMLAFKFWPQETPIAIDHAKSWASAHGRHYAVWGLAILAAALGLIGVIGLT
jgi:hypothetical protein